MNPTQATIFDDIWLRESKLLRIQASGKAETLGANMLSLVSRAPQVLERITATVTIGDIWKWYL
jgi:hypothetical protein